MEVQFILERVHKRSIMRIRAYRVFFTDANIYFIHLGEDAGQMPMGQAVGGLIGAMVQDIAEDRSEKAIAMKLERIEKEGLDAVTAQDKRSSKISYSYLQGFESGPRKWNTLAYVRFRIIGQGSLKFTFDPQMQNIEEERQAITEFMLGKRPDLARTLPR